MFEVNLKEKELGLKAYNVNATLQESLKQDVAEICSLLTNSFTVFRRDFVRAGYLLAKIQREKSYVEARRKGSPWFSYGDVYVKAPFEKFCKEYLGLSESTVYALIGVWKRFGTEDGEVDASYVDYKYSQLVEMLPLSDVEVSLVSPDMKISQIKAIKKRGETTTLSKEVKRTDEKNTPSLLFDLVKKKEEFKKLCKQFFELNDVVLQFSGEKIGGQAFGTRLFAYLEARNYFAQEKVKPGDKDENSPE